MRWTRRLPGSRRASSWSSTLTAGSPCATTAAASRSTRIRAFPDKSALEVILTTLHSGGKFGGNAYKTSGGLHGVGVSVVNALSDGLEVEVARDRRLWRQRYRRGVPEGPVEDCGPVHNRRGTTLSFHPDPEIFADAGVPPGAAVPDGALEGLSVPRRRDPLALRPVAAAPGGRAAGGAAAFSGRSRRLSDGEP